MRLRMDAAGEDAEVVSSLQDQTRYQVSESCVKEISVRIAEAALGHPLPTGAEVHHVDGNRKNNARSNLVICQDREYHLLLHKRQRLLRCGGNPNNPKHQFNRVLLATDMAENGLHGRALAHAAGLSEATVNRFLTNKLQSEKAARKIAAVFGYPVSRYFVGVSRNGKRG